MMGDNVHHFTAVPLVVHSEQKTLVVSSEQKKRRPRGVTLDRVLREAAKAGANVTGAIVEPGKVTLTFDPEPTEAANPWLAEIERLTKQ